MTNGKSNRSQISYCRENLFFSPGQFDIKQGDNVIVETARGVEFGRVVSGVKEVAEEDVIQPLKSVIRIATEQDQKVVNKNKQKEKEAFKICLEKSVSMDWK